MSAPVITGQRHWQAPDKLRIRREPGWAYKYMRKQDVERRLDEGWEIVVSDIQEGKPDASLVERAKRHRSLILMRMPTEMRDERNAHYREKHNRRVRAVARGAHMSAVRNAATSAGHSTEDGRTLAGTIGAGLQARQGVVTKEGLTHTDNITIPLAGHPDELREDMRVAEELQKQKSAPDSEGEAEKAPLKAKKRR